MAPTTMETAAWCDAAVQSSSAINFPKPDRKSVCSDVGREWAQSGRNLGYSRNTPICPRLRVGKEKLHSRRWSVRPCVRPVCAVHLTAGHNALRGSGPGQKLAFDNALAHVGCPDRRIDRLCITCCSPSQPSHHAEIGAISFTPLVRRVLCNARP